MTFFIYNNAKIEIIFFVLRFTLNAFWTDFGEKNTEAIWNYSKSELILTVHLLIYEYFFKNNTLGSEFGDILWQV